MFRKNNVWNIVVRLDTLDFYFPDDIMLDRSRKECTYNTKLTYIYRLYFENQFLKIKFEYLFILHWYAKYTLINDFYGHIIDCIWIWFFAGLDHLENIKIKDKKYFENSKTKLKKLISKHA